VLGLTLFFLSLALWRLGRLDFPSSDWRPARAEEAFYLDLGKEQQVDRAFLLVQDGGRVELEVYRGRPGGWESAAKLSLTGTWREWREISLRCRTRYLRFVFKNSTATLGELALFRGERKLNIAALIPEEGTSGAEALIDEQGYLKGPPLYTESTYFDEIYFVRTAEEHLKRQNPFEWTHPPMAKLIIGLGIVLFGATPFGWRIMGVLAGAAMIPLVFLLGRRLLGTRAGLLCAFLLTFDLMHFAESRLGTGETFILLFTILMFYFFSVYYTEGKAGYLFLSMVAFGFGFATKWVVANGLFGLTALLLIIKWRQRVTGQELAAYFGGGLLAALIYILSYIPYMMAGHGLLDVIRLQFSMYGYHAHLKATHPFASPWWSWPLMLKPLWMYWGTTDGKGSTIVTFGNPVLWWGGMVFVALTAWRLVRRRDRVALFILVPFLLQWLPFARSPRIVFIYHFFPNVLFLA